MIISAWPCPTAWKLVRMGFDFVDSSLQGLGRSSGNAATEILVAALLKQGYDLDIDFLKLLDIGQKYIQPLITTKGKMPLDIVAGFADFHSSYMHYIQKYSAKYRANPALLIIGMCKVDKVNLDEQKLTNLQYPSGILKTSSLANITLINISGTNKRRRMETTGNILKNVFDHNWPDIFIFDSIQGKTITYEDFFKDILNCKEVLEKQGIKKGDKLCLITNDSAEHLTLYFTSLIMGTVVIPIDPNKGQTEIEDVLSQVKQCHIISDSEIIAEKYHGLLLKEITESKSGWGSVKKSDLSILNALDYDSLFLITFTSGSTGIPKGVMHSFNNLVESALAFKAKFPLDKSCIFYHNLPMSYIAGILNLFILPFVSGSKIVIDERFTVSKILRFWEIPLKYKVNTFWFIPTIVVLLLEMRPGRSGPGIFPEDKKPWLCRNRPAEPGRRD